MKASLLFLAASTALAAPLESVPVARSEIGSFPIAELEAYYNAAYSVKPEETAALSPAISKRQYNGDTFNQLTDGTACRKVTLIWARGTTQSGNVGEAGSEGPVFFNALAGLVGTSNLAVQGVDYSASILGFLAGGDAAGSTTMANLVARAVTQCPSTKIVMSGYSQGGQLVHNAASKLTAAQTARVSAVLIFGDPFDGQAVGSIPASKVKVICHDGDNICDGGIIITADHRNYEQDAPAAAAFVAGLVA
ncbi:cutinase [Colletotrichum scovillei]|uniref:Cutinase n=3 Tax=Colletotrichum acutatum species complex TaxID=2707335 RepID=A0A9P7R923_9PEZI|nr:cutinase [Colletotrichum scovillei]XP_060430834.1 cutinase [Colletotrichum godetiae]KXH65345.1 cutinase [Colletotrichum nymphaeae SA-01]KAF4782745.1 cutinase [Colletotrichum scovillei]KAG7050891.1 cutinase [Colletotrichum scovillei]KAG7069931.1 cutinase [Colletotrichum scovillei]KAG7078179.1 cutinase [Colletotrichum scovillei]